jgi:hypothetical protein
MANVGSATSVKETTPITNNNPVTSTVMEKNTKLPSGVPVTNDGATSKLGEQTSAATSTKNKVQNGLPNTTTPNV